MNSCPSFRVVFKEEADFFCAKIISDDRTQVEFKQVQTITKVDNPYNGEYSIRPKMSAQVLPTKGCVLYEDVVVQAVPVFRTSNTSGGTTIYIANEV